MRNKPSRKASNIDLRGWACKLLFLLSLAFVISMCILFLTIKQGDGNKNIFYMGENGLVPWFQLMYLKMTDYLSRKKPRKVTNKKHQHINACPEFKLPPWAPSFDDPNRQTKKALIYQGKAEKAMAPHSSTLAWKIPWMEEPGRLRSTGSLRVGHDWATSLSLFTFTHWRRKWQPTPVFLPGESQERGSLVG